MNAKAKIWLAGGLAAALAVFAIGYFVVVKPASNDVSAKKTEVTSLQAQNATLQSQIDQLLAQSKQITSKQVELAKVAKRIPSDAALPTLIRRLTLDAKHSDVDLVSFTPTAVTAATPYVTGAAPYSTVGLTLEVHGTYAALHEWFTNLEDPDRRLVVVEGMTLAEPKAADTSNTLTLGPDGIPETNRTLTAAIQARTFLTLPATTTADLPALSNATATGATTPTAGTTNPAAPSPKA